MVNSQPAEDIVWLPWFFFIHYDECALFVIIIGRECVVVDRVSISRSRMFIGSLQMLVTALSSWLLYVLEQYNLIECYFRIARLRTSGTIKTLNIV